MNIHKGWQLIKDTKLSPDQRLKNLLGNEDHLQTLLAFIREREEKV